MASAQPEPSMEEILASIRRIISEDDAPEETGELSEATESPSFHSESLDDAQEAVSEPPAASSTVSETLDAPSGLGMFADSGAAGAFGDEGGGADAATASQAPVSREALSQPTSEPEPMISADERAVEADPKQAFAAAPPSAGAEVPGDASGGAASILADETANVAGDAFRSLTRSIRVSSEGEKSLEDIVTDLLRPIVKEWLDRHLATIVEEKVQDEVERIARRAR